MTTIDQDIAERILAANGLKAAALGLRFDRVALRVLAEVRAFVEAAAPAGVGVLMTLTAPIRLPGRTVEAVTAELGGRLSGPAQGGDLVLAMHGNEVRLRVLSGVGAERFVGFVHNPGSAERLLDLAEGWVRVRPSSDPFGVTFSR